MKVFFVNEVFFFIIIIILIDVDVDDFEFLFVEDEDDVGFIFEVKDDVFDV